MHEGVERLRAATAAGVLPAMATPLSSDGYTVDAAAVNDLVAFLLDRGVNALFVGGTTGEGILLEAEQRFRLHEAAMNAVNGRAPVLAHVGANTTRETRRLMDHAAGLGLAGVVCITPTFYGMPDDDLLAYFQEIAALGPETPFLVYDIPQMAATGVNPALLRRMQEEIPNFAGIKCSRPDAQMIRQLIDAAGDALLFAGNEQIALGSLALGATGLISGLATAIPEPFVTLTTAYARGDMEAARSEQRRINALLSRIPPNRRIGAIKLILQQRGCPVGRLLPPRQMPEDAQLWSDLAALL